MKILKIGADWCPECLIMKPLWQEIEKEIPGLKTEYFDYDKNKELREKYHIKHVPTFIFLDENNQEVAREHGIVKKDKLMEIIKSTTPQSPPC
ncbi:thioredoxin family protein [bacterium]|nr:thioredoxin family protein [bacterium]